MQDDLVALFNLTPEQFGALDDAAVSALSLRLADFVAPRIRRPANAAEAEQTPTLLAIWAPRTLEEDVWRDWPLLVGRYSTGWRGWAVRWETNAWEVIVDLPSGKVVCNRFGISDKKRYRTPKASRSTAAPDDFQAATVSTGLSRYRIFEEKSDGEAPPNRFAVTLLNYDIKSNTVLTDVIRKAPSTPPGPELKVEESPEVKTDEASSLEAGHLQVKGTMLQAAVALNAEQSPEKAIGVRTGTQLVRGAILVIGLDAADAVQENLWLPLGGSGDALHTRFQVNLDSIRIKHDLSGELQVYLVVGGTVTGPTAVTF